jgi:S1-C subfamily serine protease
MWGSPLLFSTITRPHGLELASVRRSTSVPASGTWVIAVWRTGTHSAFAVGTAVTSAPAECRDERVETLVVSQPLTPVMAGGGVFDLEGRLLGVVLPCGDRMVAMTPDAIDRMAAAAATADPSERAARRFGVQLAPLREDEARFFSQASGVLIREVWSGSIADGAGLTPGDIVTAVDGRTVDSAHDFLDSVAHSSMLRVRRGRTGSEVSLATPAENGTRGVHLSPAPSLRVDRVLPGS